VVPVIFTGSAYDVIDVNECFHDFMFVNRAPPPPASVNLVLQHGAKPWKVSIALFVDYSRTIRTIRRLFVLFADYSYYSSPIRGLFVLFFAYSRTIRWLFADYSYYSSTIRTIRFTILVLSIAVVYDKKKRTRKSQRSNFLTVMSYAAVRLFFWSFT
jgi:hypothetical protein